MTRTLKVEADERCLPRLSHARTPFVRLRRMDTWQGRSLRPDEVARECTSRGLTVQEVRGKGTVLMWLGGRKG
jgi:hypothetical protein